MQRLFSIAAVASLPFFVVTCGLTIVSFDRSSSYIWEKSTEPVIRAVYLDEYAVGYFRNRNEYIDTSPDHHDVNPSLPLAYTPGWNSGVPQGIFAPNERHAFLGISWSESNTRSPVDATTYRTIAIVKVNIPLWWPLVVLGILPAWWALRFQFARQQQRRREGRCLACGYDLAGNVSGVCPECGTAVAQGLQATK